MAIKVFVLLFFCLAVSTIVEGGCICTKKYKPVCGNDGKTYSNYCLLICARVRLACGGKCPCKPIYYGKPRKSGKPGKPDELKCPNGSCQDY